MVKLKRAVVGVLTGAVAIAASASGASAAEQIAVRQPVANGSVVSTSPFTWAGSDARVSLTATFTPLRSGATGALAATYGDLKYEDLSTGAVTEVTGVAAVNADHSVTGTVTPVGAATGTPFTDTPAVASSICWQCVGAWFLAGAAAGAACGFSANPGVCVAGGALAAGAAAAYCESNPCDNGPPSCSATSWVGANTSTTYPDANVVTLDSVTCSKPLDHISITYQLYQDSHPYYSASLPTCYNTTDCSWNVFWQLPSGHCYLNSFWWTGQYTDPATSQTLNYSNGGHTVDSQQYCF